MSLLRTNTSLPVNTDGANRNRTNDNINANEVISSPDINISRGSVGTRIEIQPSYEGSGLVYGNEFDAKRPYQLETITKTTGSADFDGFGDITPIGNWICESPIPRPSKRLAGIKYAPILPEPTVLAHEVTNLATQGRYWHSLGSGGSNTNDLPFWDYSSSYSPNQRVLITSSITQYIGGSSSFWVYPGIAHSEKPIESLTSGSRSGSVQVPYYPMDNNSYWKIESMGIQQLQVCGKTAYVQFQYKEPAGSPQIVIF